MRNPLQQITHHDLTVTGYFNRIHLDPDREIWKYTVAVHRNGYPEQISFSLNASYNEHRALQHDPDDDLAHPLNDGSRWYGDDLLAVETIRKITSVCERVIESKDSFSAWLTLRGVYTPRFPTTNKMADRFANPGYPTSGQPPAVSATERFWRNAWSAERSLHQRCLAVLGSDILTDLIEKTSG